MRRATALAVLLVVGGLLACGTDDPRAERAGLDLPDDAALMPPASVDGRPLTTLELGSRIVPTGPVRGRVIVVARVDDDVVAVTERSADAFRDDGYDLESFGRPGPTVDGRPTGISELGVLRKNGVLIEVGDAIVEVSSRTRPVDALAALAAQVTTPVDEDGAVPGEVIGVLRVDTDRPVAVASYGGGEGEYRYPSQVFAATPAEQEAYLALAHVDPDTSIDLRTEASCCAEEIMRPRRTVTVRGIESTIASLTTSTKILIVPGDPGIVVMTTGVRSWDDTIPTDAEMIAIAEGSEAVSREALVARVRARDDAALAAQIEEIRAGEEAQAWDVLVDLVIEEHPVVVSTGSTPRPEDQDPDSPQAPSLCAVYLSEHVSTGFPIAVCVPPDAPDPPMVLGSSAADGGPLYAGSVSDDVARVTLEYPDGAIEARFVDIPSTGGIGVRRLFLLVATIDQQIEIAGDDLTQGMRDATFVAYDDRGAELVRIPQFPHLRR